MYPELPEISCYINGKDMAINYGLLLIDGYTLNPPPAKEHKVDVPGRNGSIDLIEELLGDAVYQNATHSLEFIVINPQIDIEDTRTAIKNRLDGKTFNYSFSFDPEYTYRGKWTVEEVSHETYSFPDHLITAKIKIDAQPFKHKPTQVLDINAVGGTMVNVKSGRERVQPTFTFGCATQIVWNNKEYYYEEPGTYIADDITFSQGENELFISTYTIKHLTWKYLAEHPLDINFEIMKTRRFFEWQNTAFPSGSGMKRKDWTYAWPKWDDASLHDWDSYSSKKWKDLQYEKEITDNIPNVKMEYEWGDL